MWNLIIIFLLVLFIDLIGSCVMFIINCDVFILLIKKEILIVYLIYKEEEYKKEILVMIV
jgi:hypothetical protein